MGLVKLSPRLTKVLSGEVGVYSLSQIACFGHRISPSANAGCRLWIVFVMLRAAMCGFLAPIMKVGNVSKGSVASLRS